MPIGEYENFAALKAHLRSQYGKKVGKKRMGAITAAVADKMQPGWRKEAAAKRKENGK